MKQFFHTRHVLRLAVFVLAGLVTGCGNSVEGGDAPTQHAQDFERGPNNGRMLRDGDFALEVTLFESDAPPEFRVYPYRDDLPLAPDTVDLTLVLGRLGDRVDRYEFHSRDDFLRSDGVVHEPHSFDVTLTGLHSGKQFRWRYESYEGRTQIDSGVAHAMGIEVSQATRELIRETIPLQGHVTHHPNAVTEVRGRFPGLVQSLQKAVGDRVVKGEPLARVQSNESLQSYVVSAPHAGTVIARGARVGSESSNDALYLVADMSRLVADFKVYSRDLGQIAVGQTLVVSSLEGKSTFTGTIERVLPMLDVNSGTATARVLLGDAGTGWRPGQFVQGIAVVAEREVSLAVRQSGLQSFRDFKVVYARFGDTYEVRMLDLGRRDGEFVEVLGGLQPGTTYVSTNSYLVKADIEKSGASHDH